MSTAFASTSRASSSFPRPRPRPLTSSSSSSLWPPPAPAGPPRTPFEMTTLSLLKLGSLPMDRFVQNNPSEELEGFDIPLVDPANPHGYSLDKKGGDDDAAGEWEDDWRNVPESEAARYLRSVVQRIFGNNASVATGAGKDILRYEFIDELGENRKSCILTVTRPNGATRSYRTKPEFSRKSDAKLAAASLGLRMGAVPFLRWGEESGRARLAKLDAKGKSKSEHGGEDGNKNDGPSHGNSNGIADGEKAILEIENCCTEWRAGAVIPQWVYLIEQKLPNAFGCAVKISLSPHIQRTWSVLVSIDHPKKSVAKAACAKLAMEEGILEYIKHGDGLDAPRPALPGGGPIGGNEGSIMPSSTGPVTLQAFYAALPKPMPEEIGTKSNGELNAVAWLNNMVQFAKGSRMTVTFHWHTDAKVGLHGCLLRLTRPDAPSQSYLIDAMFSKRADAKVAVCLYACSQGFGDYIRRVAAEVDARVTPLMRRRCVEEYLPALGAALNRVRHGLRPEYGYTCDLASELFRSLFLYSFVFVFVLFWGVLGPFGWEEAARVGDFAGVCRRSFLFS
ncbi:hypothetical protein M422DRAFT_28681 [Sphaerobolus stellatus SS14]|uniref:Uncharacterized protein n=1 Tax=Sphaerobolus stellatus (strain SS14) TaxID=990650 RepID=A0A0C9UW35_SPHS4|nr:hypothetical protein M422DRAFT_28681 [Sphaerobolus stellatus SS14]